MRSKSRKLDLNSTQISDPAVSGQLNSQDSCNASPSWFANITPGRRKKQIQTFSLDENTICAQRMTCRNRDRRMSPVRNSNFRRGGQTLSRRIKRGNLGMGEKFEVVEDCWEEPSPKWERLRSRSTSPKMERLVAEELIPK
ncbi:uncharacterized protein Fot_50189 [Forsythia ovata]|uniref:Uncharacterized protein n=1 Tax=Forsythia ovata TaxID=205694 RepID=A0ABD1PXG3_9LAMI